MIVLPTGTTTITTTIGNSIINSTTLTDNQGRNVGDETSPDGLCVDSLKNGRRPSSTPGVGAVSVTTRSNGCDGSDGDDGVAQEDDKDYPVFRYASHFGGGGGSDGDSVVHDNLDDDRRDNSGNRRTRHSCADSGIPGNPQQDQQLLRDKGLSVARMQGTAGGRGVPKAGICSAVKHQSGRENTGGEQNVAIKRIRSVEVDAVHGDRPMLSRNRFSDQGVFEGDGGVKGDALLCSSHAGGKVTVGGALRPEMELGDEWKEAHASDGKL